MNSHTPVNLLADSNERFGFYGKFTTALIFSTKFFTLLQKKGANYSLKGENCKITPTIQFLEKITDARFKSCKITKKNLKNFTKVLSCVKFYEEPNPMLRIHVWSK